MVNVYSLAFITNRKIWICKMKKIAVFVLICLTIMLFTVNAMAASDTRYFSGYRLEMSCWHSGSTIFAKGELLDNNSVTLSDIYIGERLLYTVSDGTLYSADYGVHGKGKVSMTLNANGHVIASQAFFTFNSTTYSVYGDYTAVLPTAYGDYVYYMN